MNEIEPNTEAITRLAWCRILGLPDDALAPGVAQPAVREHDRTLMVVTLFDRIAVIGPSWFIDRAAPDPYRLVDQHALLAAGHPHQRQLIGQAELSITDRYLADDATAAESLRTVGVSPDRRDAERLEQRCTADDVGEAGLADKQHLFAVLDSDDDVVAGAGYDEWRGLLAHLAVLTPPGSRRRGWGAVAAAIATNDALDSGLIAGWRARVENDASRGLARRLGYRVVGSQTTARLMDRDDG